MGDRAGWIVAILSLTMALASMASRAGAMENRILTLEKQRETDSVRIEKILDSVARIEESIKYAQH